MKRSRTNHKLRAKQGKAKWRAERGRLHPVPNVERDLLRQATRIRIGIERSFARTVFPPAEFKLIPHMEENMARVFFDSLPGVLDIENAMSRGKWNGEKAMKAIFERSKDDLLRWREAVKLRGAKAVGEFGLAISPL